MCKDTLMCCFLIQAITIASVAFKNPARNTAKMKPLVSSTGFEE